jgi:hypothetical protein
METYNGHVRTPNDAIILFEACRLGLLPRVQRRLSEKERQSIRSGSVFVWDEREAGMRRWTDGKSWSASRVSGSFLTYREMEGKRGGSGFAPPVSSRGGKTPDSGRNSGDDRDMDAEEGPDGYRYKPDGLMKQSFSITTSNGQHLHLISYYARSHPNAPGLQQPTTDPNLRQIRPAKGMYPESSIADQSQMPAVTRAPMAGAPGYAMSSPNGGFPRPGATHPQGYVQQGYAPPGYHYQPSPMASPPNGYPYPYPGPGALPPIGTNGPYSGQHYAPQQHPAASPQQQHQQLQLQQQAPAPFDQRPQRTLETHLPQPPPMPQYSHPTPTSNAPAYMHPPQAQYVHPAAPQRSPPPQQVTAAQALLIDPQLMGPASAPAVQMNGQNNGQTHGQPNGQNVSRAEEGDSESRPHENAATPISAASQAPTIGALVNGNTDVDADTGEKKEQNGERQGSASPGGSKENTAPQDIPSEKLAFREDKRVLSQLDKMFAA